MSKVVYLLGAGASFGSRGIIPLASQFPIGSDNVEDSEKRIIRGLPILNEFPDAVEQLLEEIEEYADKDNDFCAEKKILVSEVLNNILKISKEYPTIDTYSKMLYTTKQFEEYEKFKAQIALFFLIWQKSHKHDIRYDSFIASLIDANTAEFPPLTILTWNYDMQFEMSYSKYVLEGRALWKIWDQLNVCCKSNGSLPKYKVDNPFAFIKLNGSAMFHALEQDSHSLRYTLQDVLWSTVSEKQFWADLYDLYTNGQHKNIYTIPKFANELSYAWDDFGKKYICDNIKQRVSDCESLVVIGYSFPYVNRDIDRHIFMCMPKLKKVYIQDKNALDIEGRVNAIIEYILKDTQRIVPVLKSTKEVSQFIIPNELG